MKDARAIAACAGRDHVTPNDISQAKAAFHGTATLNNNSSFNNSSLKDDSFDSFHSQLNLNSDSGLTYNKWVPVTVFLGNFKNFKVF